MKESGKLKRIMSFLLAFAMIFSLMQVSNIKSVRAATVTPGNEGTQIPGLIFRVGDENGDIRIVDKAADNKSKYVIRQLQMAKKYTLEAEEGYTLVDVKKPNNMELSVTESNDKKKYALVNIKDYSAFVLTVKIANSEGIETSYDINIDFRGDSSLEFKKISITYSGQGSTYTDSIEFGVTNSNGEYVQGPIDSKYEKASIQLINSSGLAMDFKIEGHSGKSVDLVGGRNEFNIIVSSNGISKIYTLVLNKKGQALLKSLTPSFGKLSPAFNSQIFDYEVTVPTTQEKISFTPVTVDNSSTIKVNKSTVSSGKKSPDISLQEGKNNITITVTSDKDVNVYTITVIRTEQFRSNQLTGLTLTSGTLSPVFNKGIYEYTTIVDNNVTSIGVKPIAEDKNSTIKIDGKVVPSGATSPYINLDEGGNIITITVTDTKNNKQTYTVNITRRYPKNNANLSSLSVSDGKLNPIFDPEIYLYSVTVARNIDNVRLKFSTQNDKAVVKINGVEYKTGQSDKIKLNLGVNNVKVEVIAEDGTSHTTYSLSIIRDKVEGKYQWVVEGDQWTYYNGYGVKVKNDWVKYDNLWYYMDINGYKQTGWKLIGGIWYYFNSDGIMQTGWMYDKGYWYYLQENGALRTNGWAMYDGNWYLFNELGEMQTGWHQYGGNWYYMSDTGIMQKGWITYDKNKYYLNDDGSMRTGWLFDGRVWYYFGEDGQMKIGWQTIDGKKYYFDSSGAMKTGMMFLDGKWINLGNA